jgi:hypothetical protein
MCAREKVHDVWVEARVATELEEGRWKAGRTDELRLAATACAAERLSVAPVWTRSVPVVGG